MPIQPALTHDYSNSFQPSCRAHLPAIQRILYRNGLKLLAGLRFFCGSWLGFAVLGETTLQTVAILPAPGGSNGCGRRFSRPGTIGPGAYRNYLRAGPLTSMVPIHEQKSGGGAPFGRALGHLGY